ncbi:hypothetical protein YDYSG_32360 [Paenibacillus tyrfis]|nr:hypothetical protein YDYSG_32360 [Paenibacillus tyrfis]
MPGLTREVYLSVISWSFIRKSPTWIMRSVAVLPVVSKSKTANFIGVVSIPSFPLFS